MRRYTKVTVTFEPRPDGGLRAFSDDVPGFVLSHRDHTAVIADVETALSVILSEMWGTPVEADLLTPVRDHAPIEFVHAVRSLEFVAHAA